VLRQVFQERSGLVLVPPVEIRAGARKQIVIMLKLKEMSEVRKHREVYFHKKERTT
jgi:hypothetical protein